VGEYYLISYYFVSVGASLFHNLKGVLVASPDSIDKKPAEKKDPDLSVNGFPSPDN